MLASLVEYTQVDGVNRMVIRKVLSSQEVDTIEKIQEQLARFFGIRSLYLMLLDNYIDLVNFLKEETTTNESRDIYRARDTGHHTNRILVNYLSSTKMFIEHTEMRIKKYYGQDSANFKLWKQATAKEYDENFEYRFLYQLRNYTQHIGLPVSGMTESLTENDEPKIELYFVKKHLLGSNFNWKKIRDDLEKMPDEFLISDIVKKYNVSMMRLYRASLLALVSELAPTIENYQKLLCNHEIKGIPFIFKFKDQKDRLKKLRGLGASQNNLNLDKLPHKEILECAKDLKDLKVARVNFK